MHTKSIVFLVVILGAVVATVRYDNFSLYRIIPKDLEDVSVLTSLEKAGKFDFWTHPSSKGLPVDILVAPADREYIETLINTNEMDFKVVMENVQDVIDEEAKSNNLTKVGAPGDLTWDRYHSLDEINAWLQKLANDYPHIVSLLIGGTSYEGRQILGVKISFGPGNERKGVWIDSLIHAREWIAGATTTFILNEILQSPEPNVRRIAESHDWYFFPVINPDGYEYSRTNERLWRKNRAPAGLFCTGVDLNRNWDYMWNFNGAASFPCLETYAGTQAFSEPESRTLSQFITSIADNLEVFLSVHSYSQLILIPYGDSPQHKDNYEITYPVGVKAAQALSVRYGTQYIVGNIVEVLYQAYGGSGDWAKAANRIPFVYTYELRDLGRYGFLLPPEQIIPSGFETLDSVLTLVEEADRNQRPQYFT